MNRWFEKVRKKVWLSLMGAGILSMGVIILRCSVGTIAGGVSEETNARINGTTKDSTGNGVPGVIVLLRQVIITNQSDSIIYERKVTSNDTGYFAFDTVPDGKYALVCFYNSNTLSAIQSKISLSSGDSLHNVNLILSQSTPVKGRIILSQNIQYQNISVFIPGLNNQAPVDIGGFYTLPNIPVGQYEISFVFNGTANYLPVLTSTVQNDSIFVKDVYLSSDSNKSAVPYSFFPSNTPNNLSIIPIEYKQANEPQWYSGHDYSKVTYFRGVQDTLGNYTPHVTQVLFMANTDSGLNQDDDAMVDHLRQNLNTVFIIDDDVVTLNDANGIDLIYISYSAEVISAGALFKNTAIPLISCERNSYFNLKFVEPPNIGMAFSRNKIKLINPGHPLSAGLFDTLVILDGVGTFTFGKPLSSATVIAVDPSDPDDGYIFAYDVGDALFDMDAPARRIAFFPNEGVGRRFNENGWKIFDAAVEWALGSRKNF